MSDPTEEEVMRDIPRQSDDDWRLLGLAGIYNTEQSMWNVYPSADGKGTDVIREGEYGIFEDRTVMATFPEQNRAWEARSVMEDIAAAKAFIAALITPEDLAKFIVEELNQRYHYGGHDHAFIDDTRGMDRVLVDGTVDMNRLAAAILKKLS